MTHRHAKWVKTPVYVPRKVIYLHVERLRRDLKDIKKAGEILDEHDRARLWDKQADKVADKYDYGGFLTEEEALNSVYEEFEEWDGNEDGGS